MISLQRISIVNLVERVAQKYGNSDHLKHVFHLKNFTICLLIPFNYFSLWRVSYFEGFQKYRFSISLFLRKLNSPAEISEVQF